MPFRSPAGVSSTYGTPQSQPGLPPTAKPADPKGAPSNVFPLIPNQIRSLILNRSDAVKNKWVDMGIDIINSPDTSELYRYNYDMIVQVEVFRGYEMSQVARSTRSGTAYQRTTRDEQGPISLQTQNVNLMKAPIFTRLGKGELERLRKTRGNIALLCRIRKYTNETLGIGISDGIAVKYFDEYFLISKSPAGFRSRRKLKRSSSAENTIGLAKTSVGHGVMGVLMSENAAIDAAVPALQSNIIIKQRSKKKLDIL